MSSPKVRDACENCHRRKTRCILPHGSSACQTCSSTGNTCLFAPRVKSGRPRRVDAETRQSISSPTSSETISAGYTDLNKGDRLCTSAPSYDDGGMLNMESRNFSSPSSLENFWGPSKMHGFRGLAEMDFVTQANHIRQNDYPNRRGSDGDVVPKDAQQVTSPLGILTPLSTPNIGFFEPVMAHAATTSLIDSAPITTNYLTFDSTLQICADLDRDCRHLRSTPQLRDGEIQRMVDLICNTCTAARTSSSCDRDEKASSALMLAAVFKSFDLCEVLVARIQRGDERRDLGTLLRWKKLDVALLEARIFLEEVDRGNCGGNAGDGAWELGKGKRVSLLVGGLIDEEVKGTRGRDRERGVW